MTGRYSEQRTYQVVCTESYWDVGLMILAGRDGTPRRVLARSNRYSPRAEYGGVSYVKWVLTGIYLTEKEWLDLSYEKSTDQILAKLGIRRKKIKSKEGFIRKLISTFLAKVDVRNLYRRSNGRLQNYFKSQHYHRCHIMYYFIRSVSVLYRYQFFFYVE